MIRIDDEKGGGEFVINSFFFYPHELDVVLHPRQSLEPSSRGTTSPAPDGSPTSPAPSGRPFGSIKKELPSISRNGSSHLFINSILSHPVIQTL